MPDWKKELMRPQNCNLLITMWDEYYLAMAHNLLKTTVHVMFFMQNACPHLRHEPKSLKCQSQLLLLVTKRKQKTSNISFPAEERNWKSKGVAD